MKKYLLFFISLVCFSCLIAQDPANNKVGFTSGKPKAPSFKKHFALSSAFSYSVINNRKELRGQYKPGVNVGLNLYTRPWFYWSAEYTYFFLHNSSPGLADINSWNTELNGNLLMGSATSDMKFRFVFGLSYLSWQGTFVGPDVVDDKTWYIGKVIYQDWVAGNIGVGFGHPIGSRFNGYADFRLRFASQAKDLVSISDTAFNFGIQFNPYSVDKKKKSKNAHPSRIYRWLKKRTN
ncbi:MAG: hypothetical protein M3R17_16135 [Bacteroidota bacterium]|nr:hypothetical protein [Bacteroidota bacterium]